MKGLFNCKRLRKNLTIHRNQEAAMPDQSIYDLCKPLSAKVLPKSMLYNSDHTARTQQEARERTTSSESVRIWRKRQARRQCEMQGSDT
jgi:hypothetical protein